MRKKILIINTCGMEMGGITTHIVNYLNAFANETKYEFTIVVTGVRNEEIIEHLKNIGCSIIYVADRKQKLLKYIMDINYIMKKQQYDVIHIHGNSATMSIELLLAKINGVQIRVAHGHNSLCNHPTINKVLKPFFRKLYTDAISCSILAGKWLFDDEYTVLHNAFDCSRYEYDESIRNYERSKVGILRDDTKIFGMIGNLNEQKNPMFALRIFEKINSDKQNKLFFIGDGELKSELEEYVLKHDMNDQVVFLGRCNDVEKKVQMIDVFLFPSKFEGLGISILEAQASGCLSIASDNVPRETKYSDNTYYLSLDEKKWINTINKSKILMHDIRKMKSLETIKKMDLDYNIIKEKEKLEKIYG